MFRFTLLTLIAFASGASLATEFSQHVPSYTSKENQFASGRQTRHFRVRLCGGYAYHNRKATLTINMPKDKWDSSIGQVIRVHVYSSSGKEIASNSVNYVNLTPVFSFMYNMAFSDLTITAITGSATSFVFKIAVSFGEINSYHGKNDCKSRSIVTDEEAIKHTFFNRNALLTTSHPVVDLVPTFVFVKPFKVKTMELIGFQLEYCFPNDLPYNVLFNILGTDARSGFSLFVCTESQTNCDEETQLHKTAGGNTVYNKFSIQSKEDDGPIRLLVKGRGRLGQMNTFNLFASTYYRGSRGY